MGLTKKEIAVFLGIIVLFFALRLPGLSIPYHQDEYKWSLYSEAIVYEPGSVPHPPLTEFIYVYGGRMVGFENFRYIPFFFAVINLFLVFYLAQKLFDNKTALWSAFLFAFSFYSVLASLTVDVDGAVIPFFFLLSLIGYINIRENNFQNLKSNWKWLTLLVVGLLGGFLIKVVFVLQIAAIALDFAIEKNVFADRKKILKYIGYGFGLIIVLVLILLSIKFIFPFFDLSKAVRYWKHFAVWDGRGWFQTGIQFVKAILYTSPLLILPALLINKEIWKKTRFFFFFICFALFFYLVAFDFSLGALDRYFGLLAMPLSIISGAVLARYFSSIKDVKEKVSKLEIIFFIIVSLIITVIQFFNHYVPPHHPKSDWINRALSFKWNFLFPFSGGSGPTGFYVSFVFMALIWIVTIVLVVSAFRKKELVTKVLFGIFILGLFYNAVFVEEYLFGKINGSPYRLFQNAKQEIINNSDIKHVIVYNDIGGWEIQRTGKYFRRMYANPQFEEEYKGILNNFNGHILFINIPRIYEDSFYMRYINSCKTIFFESEKYIEGRVLDCRK